MKNNFEHGIIICGTVGSPSFHIFVIDKNMLTQIMNDEHI